MSLRSARKFALVIALMPAALAILRAGPQAQTAQNGGAARGRGLILGKVVDGSSGQPIPGAFVAISASGRPTGQPTMVADNQGRFVFRELLAGTFDLTASARGYLAGDGHIENGMRAPSQSIELGDAEQTTDVVLRLFKPARISGTIVDDVGDPVEGAQIGVLRVEYIAGHRRLRTASGSESDDRGFYSSGRLASGSYVVAAIMRRTTVPVSTRELIDRLAGATAKEQQDFQRSVAGSGVFDVAANGFRIGDFILQPGYGGASAGPAPSLDGKLLAAPSLYYPGVTSAAEATAITVGAGDDRRGVNLQVRLTPSVRVSGRIVGPDGPIPNLGVRLVPDGSEALVFEFPLEQGATITTAAGAFTFLGVPSGSYAIKAHWLPPAPRPGPPGAAVPPTPDGPTLSGSLPVSVGEADVTDLLLTLRRGPLMQGRIVFAGNSPRPIADQLSRGVLRFELADGRAPRSPPMPPLRGSIEPDGQFRTIGLPTGRYVLRIDGYPGWTLESAMWQGRDISDDAFDAEGGGDDLAGVLVTLTDAPAGISGVVRTLSGAPLPQATVLVFSPSSTHWIDRGSTPRRLLRTATSKTGAFVFSGLPAGEYLALAFADEPPENWGMPEFLSLASRAATRVTVEPRTTRTVNLTVTAMPRGGGQ